MSVPPPDLKPAPVAICFGEVLWDLLPNGPVPGGAPLNVAYHLNRLGVPGGIMSRVGCDEGGKELRELITGFGIDDRYLQIDTVYPTGYVKVSFGDHGEPDYEIAAPVAWDFIDAPDPTPAGHEFLIFGSLASRNPVSRAALLPLLQNKAVKVCDINLRPPFIDRELIGLLLSAADIVKFNGSEIGQVHAMFSKQPSAMDGMAASLRNRFGIREIIVTRGAEGAVLYDEEGKTEARGPKITVCDTIGSGDAFLAAFIAAKWRMKSPGEALADAVNLGAFVATQRGACPVY